MATKTLFDFFISYKRKDTSEFVNNLKNTLEKGNYDIWLDTLEILPGDSILSGIEKGISNSLTVILVFSEHYFEGWSEHERRAAFNLANSKKVHLVPVWYKIDNNFILKNAPLFADLNAIVFDQSKQDPIIDIANQLTKSFRPTDKRAKLFEFYFKCLIKKFPDDPELKMFVSLYDNDIKNLQDALEAGANPNITDIEIYNRYAKISMDAGCFDEWRKLFLFFHEQGQLNMQQENGPQ
jgi:hypothetical protein